MYCNNYIHIFGLSKVVGTTVQERNCSSHWA